MEMEMINEIVKCINSFSEHMSFTGIIIAIAIVIHGILS